MVKENLSAQAVLRKVAEIMDEKGRPVLCTNAMASLVSSMASMLHIPICGGVMTDHGKYMYLSI